MSVSLKSYVRDQVRRNAERFSRPIRIARGYGEYQDRRRAASEVPRAATYDVDTLQEQGYLRIQPPQALVSELVTASRQKLAGIRSLPQSRNKAFFSQLLGATDLELDGVFMRFALDDKLLGTTALYLGVAPFLESVELLYSKPIEGQPAQSQQWHRDRTDRRIIKVFVYAVDVTPRQGPLSLLSRSDSARVPELLFHYVPDQQMARYVEPGRTIALTGPAGTTIMTDTQACYHLGSRCQEPRLAYVAYYSSGFGYRPREGHWQVPETQRARLTPLQRLALGSV
ncbi:MAG TPA: hypothetical protein VF252_05385 [Gemmatimonadales bacterium]